MGNNFAHNAKNHIKQNNISFPNRISSMIASFMSMYKLNRRRKEIEMKCRWMWKRNEWKIFRNWLWISFNLRSERREKKIKSYTRMKCVCKAHNSINRHIFRSIFHVHWSTCVLQHPNRIKKHIELKKQ